MLVLTTSTGVVAVVVASPVSMLAPRWVAGPSAMPVAAIHQRLVPSYTAHCTDVSTAARACTRLVGASGPGRVVCRLVHYKLPGMYLHTMYTMLGAVRRYAVRHRPRTMLGVDPTHSPCTPRSCTMCRTTSALPRYGLPLACSRVCAAATCIVSHARQAHTWEPMNCSGP